MKEKDIIDRVMGIYNDCWLIYKKFLETHNMRQYSEDLFNLRRKYGGHDDIDGLAMWFMPIVSKIQAAHYKEMKKSE